LSERLSPNTMIWLGTAAWAGALTKAAEASNKEEISRNDVARMKGIP
jgi:hypothetical protein